VIYLLAALVVTVGLAMAWVAHGRRYPPDRRPGYLPTRRPRR